MGEDFILRAFFRKPFLIQFLLHQPFIFMKKKTGGRKVKRVVLRCDQAVDVEHWDLMVARAYWYFRVGVVQISRAEAARRSGGDVWQIVAYSAPTRGQPRRETVDFGFAC